MAHIRPPPKDDTGPCMQVISPWARGHINQLRTTTRHPGCLLTLSRDPGSRHTSLLRRFIASVLPSHPSGSIKNPTMDDTISPLQRHIALTSRVLYTILQTDSISGSRVPGLWLDVALQLDGLHSRSRLSVSIPHHQSVIWCFEL